MATVSRGGEPRALHLHDAAFTGATLVAAARRAGLPWRRIDLPVYYRRTLPRPLGTLQAKVRGPVWDAWLAARTVPWDLLHVHTGTLAWHARWVQRPYVVHLHGSDIRSTAYRPEWRGRIAGALRRAAAVVYASPDLAEHVRPLRDDATYFPQPVDVGSLPIWAAGDAPRVVFASRWESVKGGAAQVEVAKRLRGLAPDAELVGLDWGALAPAAAAEGVRLVPKLPRSDYRRLLASASVVVGQLAPILSVSELEALGSGVPLVGGFRHEWYPALTPLSDPTPAAVADAAAAILGAPGAAATRQQGPAYVRAEHDADVGVDRLRRLYQRLTRRP